MALADKAPPPFLLNRPTIFYRDIADGKMIRKGIRWHEKFRLSKSKTAHGVLLLLLTSFRGGGKSARLLPLPNRVHELPEKS